MGQLTEPTPDPAPLLIDDTLWEHLMVLTGGAAGPCYQCGSCTAVCPWGQVKDAPVSVRQLIRQAQLGLFPETLDLWLCTTCAQCETFCPRGVNIASVLRGLRMIAWERRQIPAGLPSVLWSTYWNNNPWTQPPSHRAHWAADLNLDAFDARRHEILLYVGCTASFDPRAGQIARALVKILNAANVSFGYLGDDEPCCGEAVLSVGHLVYFQELAKQAACLFASRGVETLVTISPHCYDVFRNHLPTSAPPLEAFHYTQYLAGLITTGRLTLPNGQPAQITIQDPCYLARHNRETAAPRVVLDAAPGLTLTEMAQTRENTLCCGGGGGRMWLETAAGERFADLRIQEAIATGAEVLVTACPFCIACLEDSIKAQRIEGLAVRDVAEIVAQAI